MVTEYLLLLRQLLHMGYKRKTVPWSGEKNTQVASNLNSIGSKNSISVEATQIFVNFKDLLHTDILNINENVIVGIKPPFKNREIQWA